MKALQFLHRSGFCHNSISAESIWLSTMNQEELELLDVRLSDLGNFLSSFSM